MPHLNAPGFEQAARALEVEIAAFAPAELYCPHPQDVRPDHVAAAQLAQAALSGGARQCELFYYPIWMWYHASSGLRKRLDRVGAWRLDIATVLPAKRRAMAAYPDAPRKTSAGHPFCGRLPRSFLRTFRRPYEVFFRASNILGPLVCLASVIA